MREVTCTCGAVVPDEPGPTHRYLSSAPACWRIYGEVLAKEYSAPEYFRVHKLTVDAWAVQHPGRPSRQTIQSEAVHLARLCMLIERGWSLENADAVLARFGRRDKTAMHWLVPPADMGPITVLDVSYARDASSHCDRVWRWARSVWAAWRDHHEQIRAWVDRYV